MTALRDWMHLETDMGERGLRATRTATDEERVELARELDIPSCESLRVDYEIKPLGGGRYTFTGTLEADMTQACVVTLDPVPAHVLDTFAVELGPVEALEDAPPESGDREVSSVADVEPIENGRIEVGAIVFGIVSAALPPYPRKAGAEFDWIDPKNAADPEAANPFAALAKLKPKS